MVIVLVTAAIQDVMRVVVQNALLMRNACHCMVLGGHAIRTANVHLLLVHLLGAIG